MSELGERIKKWRNTIGDSQANFSQKTGIPLATLKGYELGLRSPGSEALVAIANTGVNMNWLLTGEGEMSIINHVLNQENAFESEEELNDFRNRMNKLYDLLLQIDEDRRETAINQMLAQVEDAVKMRELERFVKEMKKE